MARSKKKGSRDDRKKRKVKMSKGQKKRFLTEILAEVAPPKRRIRNTSFNYSAEDNLYATLHTTAFTVDNDFVEPVSGSKLTENGCAIFKIETGENEFIKLRDLPLQMGYRIEVDQTARAAGNDKEKRTFLTANKWDHFNYCINPVPGVSGILNSAEVIINGTVISDTVGMGSHSDVYKALNQKIATDENRRRDQTSMYLSSQRNRYEMASTAILNDEDVQTGQTLTPEPSPEMAAAMDLVQLSRYNSDTDVIYENFAFDGVPLLSLPRNNALANLDKDETGEDRNKMK